MRRRTVLTIMGASGLAAASGRSRAAPERRVERIGLQLYTVRDLLAKDVAGTLAAIAAAGYAEVEPAGYANLAPADFAAALKQAGLVAPSAHLRLQDLANEATLDAAVLLGHAYVVVPVPEFGMSGSAEDYRRFADHMNATGERCAARGIQLAYHNHNFEFATVDGVQPYALLQERCDPALVKFELDLFWATKAGADPAALLAAAPQRYPLCHIKDMDATGAMVAVGDGRIDFANLFAAGSGLRHFFVEHDNPSDPLDCIRRGAAALRRLRY